MDEKVQILETDALIAIDVQPTFMPGGGLPVPEGDQIIAAVRKVMNLFPRERRFATKDRHRRGHVSLASSYAELAPMTVLTSKMVAGWTEDQYCIVPHAKFTLNELKEYLSIVRAQVLWPDHAIEETTEAELHSAFTEDEFTHVLVKGLDPDCDSYSGFFDNLGRPTGLADILRQSGIRRCFLVGLAFDYCVGWSAAGAQREGFEAYVIEDATRPVGYPVDSVEKMKASFAEEGVRLIQSSDLVR